MIREFDATQVSLTNSTKSSSWDRISWGTRCLLTNGPLTAARRKVNVRQGHAVRRSVARLVAAQSPPTTHVRGQRDGRPLGYLRRRSATVVELPLSPSPAASVATAARVVGYCRHIAL
jgi:hypothetical protein